MLAWILEPLSYPFMQKALFTAIIISIICAVLSCYLVLKGWSLMGDAISHAVLPGIIIAFIFRLPLMLGAFVSGLACTLGIGYLKENTRVKEDTVMGIVFSGMFALGLTLFAKVETELHLSHILFGNLLGITQQDLYQSIVISGIVFMTVLLKRRDFLLFCFDPNYARIVGLSPKLLYYSLLILLALTIVTAMQVVGVILVSAMLITPGITAYLLTKQFEHMIVIAVMTSVLSSFSGVLLSYHVNADIGPSIVVIQAIFFCLALTCMKIKLRF